MNIRWALLSFLYCALSGGGGCAWLAEQQREGQARQAQQQAQAKAHADAVEAARSACYVLPPHDVYTETYALINAEDFTIARESERKGEIETDWHQVKDADGTLVRVKVTVDIDGDACQRVSMKVVAQGSKPPAVDWFDMPDGDKDMEDDLYLTLDQRMKQRIAATAPSAPPAPAQAAQPPAVAPAAAPAAAQTTSQIAPQR